MKLVDKMRVDKWLWTMRVFKTRSQASDACSRSRVKVNGSLAKASREVKPGDAIEVNLKLISRSLKIIQINHDRVGNKLLNEFVLDLTPQEEYDKLKHYYANKAPLYTTEEKLSKKERRDFEDFMELGFDDSELEW